MTRQQSCAISTGVGQDVIVSLGVARVEWWGYRTCTLRGPGMLYLTNVKILFM